MDGATSTCCQKKSQLKNTAVKIKEAAVVADRGLSKRTRGREAHEENIRQHEHAAAVSEQRALNRPSHMRHVEVLRTGHDVISNQVFTGREGKPPPKPRARPPAPVWDRLSGPEAAVELNLQDGTEKASTICPGGREGGTDNNGGRPSKTCGDSGRQRVGSSSASDCRIEKADNTLVTTRQQEKHKDCKPSGGKTSVDVGTAVATYQQVVPPLDLSRRSDSGGV